MGTSSSKGWKMMENKIKALAIFLGVDVEEIDEEYNNVLSYGREEYLVLTDDEADEAAREQVLDSIWVFRPGFLENYMPLDAETIGIIQQAKYDDANEPLKRLIETLEIFVDDAIAADGRGHFLASYDFEEIEAGEFYIYRVN